MACTPNDLVCAKSYDLGDIEAIYDPWDIITFGMEVNMACTPMTWSATSLMTSAT